MIDWKGIVNNAVSVLVAAVFVGAAAMVWSKAAKIDSTINTHTTRLKVNQGLLINTQSELKASQTALTSNLVDLQGKVELLNRQIIDLQQALKETKQTKATTGSTPNSEPLSFPQYQVNDDVITKLKIAEEEKIKDKIQSLTPGYKPHYQEQFKHQIQQEAW
ncbi:MAG: hypothetical protein GQ475_03150 [Methylococcaceae bacterium]|nr:hypothetical protein [Methylococcaceae bacterium]